MPISTPAISAFGRQMGFEIVADADAAPAGARLGAAGIMLMFRLLGSVRFTPYVIHRILLGAILLFGAYG